MVIDGIDRLTCVPEELRTTLGFDDLRAAFADLDAPTEWLAEAHTFLDRSRSGTALHLPPAELEEPRVSCGPGVQALGGRAVRAGPRCPPRCRTARGPASGRRSPGGAPHFEGICRQWARWYADPETYGNRYPDRVASGTVSDPGAKKTLEIDVAAFGRDGDNRDTLLAIGEAKWQETTTVSHLKRLEHVRDLLIARGEPGAESARLFLFGGAGFDDAVTERAKTDPSVQLIGLKRLYQGS